jgi:hypothetical protein
MRKLHHDAISGRLSFADIKAHSRAIPLDGFQAPIPFVIAILCTQFFAKAPWFCRMWVLQISLCSYT